MLHIHVIWLWYAVAALMVIDAVGYTGGAIGPIRRALKPSEPYWQKRLMLNLMLANHRLYLGAAIAIIGAVTVIRSRFGVSWNRTLVHLASPTDFQFAGPAAERR